MKHYVYYPFPHAQDGSSLAEQDPRSHYYRQDLYHGEPGPDPALEARYAAWLAEQGDGAGRSTLGGLYGS
jgi:hypothetical protein